MRLVAPSVAALKQLSYLDLSGTQVTAAGVKGLSKVLPKCVIAEPVFGDN